MNTIKQLIEKYCPEGVEYKKLGEMCKVLRGKRLTKKELSTEGPFPVFHGGIEPIGYFIESNRQANSVMIIDVGASAGTVGYSKNEFWSSDGCFCLSHVTSLEQRYLFFLLQSLEKDLKSKVRRAGIPTLDNKVLENLLIPVPPLPVQREIVRILDNFTSLEAELEAELEARRKQYEYYRDQLLSFKHLTGGGSNEVEWKTLGEIAEIRGRIGFRGYTRSDQVEKGQGALALTASNIINQNIDYNNSTYVTWEKYEESPEIMVHDGDIIVCQRGSIGKLALVNQLPQKATINPQLLLLKSIKCNNKYLRYYMTGQQFQKDLNKIKGIGTVQMISQSKFNGLCIPIPSMDIQHRIVSILDRFESLVNDITTGLPAEIAARHQQYEYYRDQLLTFKRKS